MIEKLDERLKVWAQTVVPEADVRLAAPCEYMDRRIIVMCLKELIQESQPSGAARPSGATQPPLEISLFFRVTAYAESPEIVQRLLMKLIYAAIEEPGFEVGRQPLAETLVNGIAAPSFLLKVHQRRERLQAHVPRVRQPAKISYSPITSLAGVVLASDDMPLSGVRIELPALKRVTHADTKGQFRFAHVPVEPPVKQLRIIAKGREYFFEADQTTIADQPLIIRFDTLEV